MREKNKVLLNSALYTFNTILLKAMSFLLLPLYTHFLTPEDYGVTNLLACFTSVASFIIAFSLYAAVSRFYVDYKNDIEKLKRFYGTVLTFVFLSGSVFLALSIIFRNILVSLFFKGLNFYPVVLIGIVGLVFACIYTVYQNILQGMQNSKKYTMTSTVYFLFSLGLNLLFIGVFKLGAKGVLIASLIANMTFSVYVVYDLKKSNLATFGIDKQLLIEALRYSLPILPHNLSPNIADFISRILINSYNSLASVGLYSVAMQFGLVADTILASVNMAFAPWFYENMNRKSLEGRAEILRLADLLIRLYGIIFLGIVLFSQEAIILMTNGKFIMAWTVIPILILAFSFKMMYYFFINVLFYYKQAARYIFIATLTSNLLSILISFLLIPSLDMYGAALAQVVTKIITVIIVIKLSLHFDNIGFKIGRIISHIIIYAIFGVVGLYFSFTKYMMVFNIYNFMYKLFVYAMYILMVLFTFRKQIKQLLQGGSIKNILKRNANLKTEII